MSYRALVAVPADSDSSKYDVYKSRNGAHRFKLHPHLEALGESGLAELQKKTFQPPRLVDIPDDETHVPQSDDPMVEKEPSHEAVSIDELLSETCYILYDALYVVGDTGVSTYYLSWTGISMQSTLAAHGMLEVYPDLDGGIPGSKEPYYRIEGDAFLDLSKATQHRPDAPPTGYVEDVLSKVHMGIYRNMVYQIGKEPGVFIVGADLTFVYHPNGNPFDQSLGMMRQFGVCIDAEIGDIDPGIVWEDFYERANTLRWNHMLQWNRYFIEEGNQSPEKLKNAILDFNEKNRIEFGNARSNDPKFVS